MRSATAYEIYKNDSRLEVKSAGTDPTASTVLTNEFLGWADCIMVMEKHHRNHIRKHFPDIYKTKRIVCLYIPDEYDYMQPELVEMLKGQVEKYLSTMYPRFNNNPLDNALFAELRQPEINKEKISLLIKQGANINAITEYAESMFKVVIAYMDYHEIKLDTLQFMIELGVDLNYEMDGTNCLHRACITQNVELVEFLLKAGANPNCSVDGYGFLLDYAEYDHWSDKNESRKIIEILKKYRAKSHKE
jgi:predicted protein tyrosine phosphatase